MMNILRIILFCLFLLQGPLKGQETILTDNSFFGRGIYENTFLTTDRNVYIAGEDIWFNVDYFINYIYQGRQLSNILYVDLLDDAGFVTEKSKYSITNNRASGVLEIPDDIRSGVYFIRAYTRYQRNFPVEAITTFPIIVVNPILPPTTLTIENDRVTKDLQLADLKKEYKTIQIYDEQEEIVYSLIDIQNSTNKNVSYILKIFSGNLNFVNENRIYTDQGISKARIAKNEIPTGLNYFILYDAQGTIVDVSAFYSFYDTSDEVTLYLKDSIVHTRERVVMDIIPGFQVNNGCYVTVAVVKHGTYFSGCSGDLPNVYIRNPWLLKDLPIANPVLKKQIDSALVMYHKYLNTPEFYQKLSTLFKDKTEYIPDIREVSLSGICIDKKTGQPVSGVPVYLSVLFDNPQLHIQKAKSDGKFIFSLNNITDVQEVYICPTAQDSGQIKILIDQDFLTDFPPIIPVSFPFAIDNKQFLEEMYLNYQLSEEFLEKKNPHKFIYIEKGNKTFGEEVQETVLADFITLKTIKEVFTEIVPNVKIRKKETNYFFQVLNNNNQLLPGHSLVLLDNIPVFDVNSLLDMHPAQIEKVEVVNKVYVLGDHAINGIIMITSKTENFAGLKLPEEAVFLKYQTISKKENFQQTRYHNEIEEESRIPDFRNLLYWNPKVKIDSKGNQLTFYTSDHESDYDIIVRGYTSEGKPFFRCQRIRVKR